MSPPRRLSVRAGSQVGLGADLHLENCIRKTERRQREAKMKGLAHKSGKRRASRGASLKEGFIKCQDIDEGRTKRKGQVTKSAGRMPGHR